MECSKSFLPFIYHKTIHLMSNKQNYAENDWHNYALVEANCI